MKKQNKVYLSLALAAMLLCALSVTAFATGTGDDPLTVINKLSDFIFGLIRAVGMILLGWGIVQVALSLQSHDPSQRSNGFLTLAGGIIITFTKNPGPHYWLIEKGGDICCPLPFLKGWIDNRCVRIEYDESERYLPPR